MTDVWVVGAGGHSRVVVAALAASGHRPHVLDHDGLLDPAKHPVVANGVGTNPGRAHVHARIEAAGVEHVGCVHPSAVFAGDPIDVHPTAQIMAGVVLQPGVCVGPGAVVNTRASVDHDCVIGACAFVAPGAVLCGDVTVGDGALVGAGATVLPGLRVGAGARLGAGAVLVRDLPDGETWTGVPAERRTR